MVREREKLERAGAWRPQTPDEVTLLQARKRCGAFKPRACVLGNLVNTDGPDVYAPVVAMTAHRYHPTEAAGEGDYVKTYDNLKDEVYVTSPTVWRSGGESPLRRLAKALYGLQQSPRAW